MAWSKTLIFVPLAYSGTARSLFERPPCDIKKRKEKKGSKKTRN